MLCEDLELSGGSLDLPGQAAVQSLARCDRLMLKSFRFFTRVGVSTSKRIMAIMVSLGASVLTSGWEKLDAQEHSCEGGSCTG